MKNLFTFIVALFMATSMYAQTETETVKEWNFSNWQDELFSKNVSKDGLLFYATEKNVVELKSGKKTIDGTVYTKRFTFNSASDLTNLATPKRAIGIKVIGNCKITLAVSHPSKNGGNRTLKVGTLENQTLTELNSFELVPNEAKMVTAEYNGNKATELLLYCETNTINIFDIKVSPASALASSITITDAGFATFAASYPVDYSADGLEAYAVKYANGTLTYDKIDGVVPANTAVLLKGEAKEYTLTAAKGEATTVDTDLKVANGEKKGDGNIYCLANKASNGVGFYQVSSSVTIPANKAYLEIGTPATTHAKYYSIGIGGNTTGIQAIQQNGVKADGIMYSLSGQKVGANYKGIVICNGKKMIKK